MKAIIESGKVNGGILSCFIMPNGIEIVFQNNDLASKFALSLIPFGISYTKNENRITTSYIN